MNFDIKATTDFLRSIKKLSKKYASLKSDFKEFAKSLKDDPFQGVELCPGIRKIRMAITSKGRGKSGGARAITYTIVTSKVEGRVYLLDIYDKADYSTIDVSLIQSIVKKLNL
jgi:mRNA-degrading endonuclease RelE of RelBE toxin-antitoxin system